MANLKEVKDPIIWASLKTTSHHFVRHVMQDDSPDSATAIKRVRQPSDGHAAKASTLWY